MNSLISKPQSAQSNTFSYRPCKALPYSLPIPRQILQLYVHIYILLFLLNGTLGVQSFTADSAKCSCMCFFDFKFALFFFVYLKLVWIILKCCYLSDYYSGIVKQDDQLINMEN